MDSLAEASFGALPSELKISILLACDSVTVYHARQISKAFRKLIDDCTEMRQDVLFLESQRPALSIGQIPEPGQESPLLRVCARYRHGQKSQLAPAKYNHILVSAPPVITHSPVWDVKRHLSNQLYNDQKLQFKCPINFERLGLGSFYISGCSSQSRLEALTAFPFPNMQLSSPPAQVVDFYGSSGNLLFTVNNHTGVNYSDVISEVKHYALRNLEVLRQKPETRSKEWKIQQWINSFNKETASMKTLFPDVIELDDEGFGFICDEIESSDAGGVEIILPDEDGDDITWGVQRHA